MGYLPLGRKPLAEHLVTFLVGVIVNAEDKESALKRAAAPFQYGAIPNMVGLSHTGTRLAQPDDRTKIQERLNEMAKQR
jgi:hypothetical protein